MQNQTNLNEVWGGAPKVNSLQDLGKLVAQQPQQIEKPVVQPKEVQEVKRHNNTPEVRAKNKAAVEYAAKHPELSIADVARKFGVNVNSLYGVRWYTKKKTKAKMAKVRAAKQAKVTDVTEAREWVQSTVSTSAKPVKQDVVNHPAHYKTGGIETIDFIEAKGLTYNLGNVVKYITRAGIKDAAKHIEDLEKAAWYLNREIENLKK